MTAQVRPGAVGFSSFGVGLFAFMLGWAAPFTLYMCWGYYVLYDGGEPTGSYLLGVAALILVGPFLGLWSAITVGRNVLSWFDRDPTRISRFVAAGVGSLLGIAGIAWLLYAAIVTAVTVVLAVAVLIGFFFVLVAGLVALARA